MLIFHRRFREHLWKKFCRSIAYWRQKGKCYYCENPVKKKKATADHLVPIQLEGKTKLSNIVMACKRCNKLKANLSSELFKQIGHDKRLVLQIRSNRDKLFQSLKERGI